MTAPAIPLFKVFVAQDVAAALTPVLASGQLASASQAAAFEQELARWLGAADVVALSDGTAALQLALQLAGVQAGDEVLVSPMACTASLMPIANIRATPAWCDIDPETGMVTPAEIVERISEYTRAVIHVQWSGDPGDVQGIAAAAHAQEMPCIVDATEALGAERDGRRWVDDADFTAYSFYATKLLSTGEGGALVCSEKSQHDRLRRLRRFGIDRTRQRTTSGDLDANQDIPEAGINASLHEIPATLGRRALPQIAGLLQAHRDNAAWLDTALAHVPGITQLRRNLRSRSACWTYSLRATNRDGLIRKLHEAGIGAQRLHLRGDRFSCFGAGPQELPGVALFDAENLSIPCGWWVDEAARERIAAVIKSGW